MTPDQATEINTHLTQIEHELHTITIDPATTDDYETHLTISNTRGKLQNLDRRLFHLFRVLERYYDQRPSYATQTPQRQYTVDDLEV